MSKDDTISTAAGRLELTEQQCEAIYNLVAREKHRIQTIADELETLGDALLQSAVQIPLVKSLEAAKREAVEACKERILCEIKKWNEGPHPERRDDHLIRLVEIVRIVKGEK